MGLGISVQNGGGVEVAKAFENVNAIGGGGIVLDIHTGEVVAKVSLPDFEPANPGEASKDARFNRITLGVYEMGSTMKTLNTAMALDYGVAKMSSSYDARFPIHIGRFTIHDDHPKEIGRAHV